VIITSVHTSSTAPAISHRLGHRHGQQRRIAHPDAHDLRPHRDRLAHEAIGEDNDRQGNQRLVAIGAQIAAPILFCVKIVLRGRRRKARAPGHLRRAETSCLREDGATKWAGLPLTVQTVWGSVRPDFSP
jgi:hypothetical protein